MENNDENESSDQWLKDLPVQTENTAFKPTEMIACAECKRMNPPSRLKCLYCGAALEIPEAVKHLLKPNLRKLEVWEKGYNLVYTPSESDFDELKIDEIARLLKIEAEALHKILAARKAVPLTRHESAAEAEIAKQRLSELKVETILVADEDLTAEDSIRRIRGIEFWDEAIIFVLFNRDQIIEIVNSEIALIVTGAICERKIEATETREKKGETKILETTETVSDEILTDIYTVKDKIGYRIRAAGFDFSGLDREKSLTAAENMRVLIEKLRRIAPSAKIVDDYTNLREILGAVWNVEQHSSAQGIKRKGVGSYHLENVSVADNTRQYTKYSLLQRHLL